jgi:DNA replication initiation complex subunit (GINS family)
MADELVDFERVTKVYREESSKKTLSRLEPDFYGKLGTYLRGLEARAAEEVTKGPNSPKAMLLQDELRKVLKKRDQIFQYRERKIALLASSKASGGEADVSGLAAPEAELFAHLVALLKQTREAAFAGGGLPPAPAPAPATAPPPAARSPATSAPAPVFQRLAEPPKKIAPPEPKDLVVVHVLEDLPTFAGIDAKYTLRKEDVVTLPRAIAKVLIDRGKVRIVQTPA